MISFMWRTAVTGLVLWIATLLVKDSMHFEWDKYTHSWQHVLIVGAVAVVFGLVNSFIKPIVKTLSIPFYILTLGLFSVIVNAFMLWLVSEFTKHVTHWGLVVDKFWWSAIWAAIVVSIIGWLVGEVADRLVDKV
ncbi:MAG: phage holin family protein [Gordonia sp. (in: high G+C Gram-positive bacteria)]|uniref:phage holin family protein n=1 Tax=Gordonia sp. (in: high G+C Gram-positive bacteria) TaxID=84139 RepID=UPI0039E72180